MFSVRARAPILELIGAGFNSFLGVDESEPLPRSVIVRHASFDILDKTGYQFSGAIVNRSRNFSASVARSLISWYVNGFRRLAP